MKIKQCILIQLAVFAVAMGYSLYMAAHLPDTVAVHWGINGQPDRYGSKWENLLIMPGVVLFMALLTAALPKLSPKNFEIEPFESTYCVVMTLLSVMMAALHFVIVQTSTGAPFDITRAMFAVIFLFFALMGNIIGRVQRNFFMGVRTPWTLADERVWRSTHRFAGRLWFFGGIAGAIASAAGLPVMIGVALLLVLSLVPVAYSYVDYQKVRKNTEPMA